MRFISSIPSTEVGRIKNELQDRGFLVGRDHVATLMRPMGITPLFPKKKLSKPAPGHKIYPYLLGNLEIIRAGEVWSMDITYLPMRRGFCYLTCVMDSRQPPSTFLPRLKHPGCLVLY